MSIVLISGDLMFQAKIMDTAKHFSVPVHIVRSRSDVKPALLKHNPKLVLLDLSLDIEPLTLVKDLKADPKTKAFRILSFGPHVERDLFAAMKHVGCDEIMPRGRLSIELASIIGSL